MSDKDYEPAIENVCGGYYCDERVGHVDCDKRLAMLDGESFDLAYVKRLLQSNDDLADENARLKAEIGKWEAAEPMKERTYAEAVNQRAQAEYDAADLRVRVTSLEAECALLHEANWQAEREIKSLQLDLEAADRQIVLLSRQLAEATGMEPETFGVETRGTIPGAQLTQAAPDGVERQNQSSESDSSGISALEPMRRENETADKKSL